VGAGGNVGEGETLAQEPGVGEDHHDVGAVGGARRATTDILLDRARRRLPRPLPCTGLHASRTIAAFGKTICNPRGGSATLDTRAVGQYVDVAESPPAPSTWRSL
jgi:hypothetical protein